MSDSGISNIILESEYLGSKFVTYASLIVFVLSLLLCVKLYSPRETEPFSWINSSAFWENDVFSDTKLWQSEQLRSFSFILTHMTSFISGTSSKAEKQQMFPLLTAIRWSSEINKHSGIRINWFADHMGRAFRAKDDSRVLVSGKSVITHQLHFWMQVKSNF